MKGFGKRRRTLIGCVLLICLLVVTVSATPAENCPGDCTHQAAIGTTHYDTLEQAIVSAASGSTVTLRTDVTVTAPLTAEKPLVLDLGGKTVTAQLSDPQQAAVSFLAGGAVKNGTIAASNGSALLICGSTAVVEKDAVLVSSGTAPALRITAGKEQITQVTLSGTVTGEALAIGAASQEGKCELFIQKEARLTSENIGIHFDSAGKLYMEDGTIQTKKDAICVMIEADRETELSISGGKLLSQEGEVIVIATGENAVAPKEFVTGGTFEKVPTAYIPSYAKLLENTDGTYTVISAYTLTFLPGSGSGIMEPVKLPCGSTVTLPQCGFASPADMDFAGWEIAGTVYAPEETYTPEGDVTVTALWKAHVHSGGSATCLKQAVCAVCGQSYGGLADHTLSHTSGYAATCTDGGMNAHSQCSVCGNSFIDGISISSSALSIPALGHSWEVITGTAATCEEAGSKQYRKCKTCGILQLDGEEVTEDALVIPAAGHAMEAIPAQEATCTAAGTQAHEVCTVCKQLFLNGNPVEEAALTTATSSHVLSDWQTDEFYHWKHCVDCSEVFRQNAHHDKDADGNCDDCGYVLPVQESVSEEAESGFSLLFLIPIVAAVAIAVPLAIRKRKE